MRRISFPTFLFKLVAGGVGGSLGSFVLLLIFLLAQSLPVLEPLTNARVNYISPIFVFILLIMVFLASTAGNILSVFLLALSERERYTRVASTIYQIFILSVIVFVLTAPVYFLTASLGSGYTGYAVAIHIIVAAQASALILEQISNPRYALVGLYGVTFSTLISAGLLFGIYSFLGNPNLLLFIALPVVWFSIAFTTGLTNIIYGWIANIYDKDFLATDTTYGRDFGNQSDDYDEDDEEPKLKDEAGSDFLRRK